MWVIGALSACGPDGGAGADGGLHAACERDEDCGSELACSDGACEPIPAACGNGEIDPGEVCDGSRLGGATCADLVELSGALGCRRDCSDFDTSACTCVPLTCDDRAA